jgi:hypothetical protein
MSRPARHGPTTVFRFRFRTDDAARLQRIKTATRSKTDADAIRHALLVADARLNGGASVSPAKETGPRVNGIASQTSGVSSTPPAPSPPLEVCMKCGFAVKPSWIGVKHKALGAKVWCSP